VPEAHDAPAREKQGEASMEHRTFAAINRTETGKGASGRLRRQGRIPAIIYGGNNKTIPITLDETEYIKHHHDLTESTLVTVKLDGKDHTVFVKDTQGDILTGKVLHVDFYEVEKGKHVRTHVVLRIVGVAEGVRAGGVFENPTHMIEVECDPSVLPEHLDVDVSKLGVNQSIHVKDLNINPEIKLISSPDTVVALVKYAKEEAAAPAAEAAASEAAPAAGAAPAADGKAGDAKATDGKASKA
jgi:large subunit ribosomal protein L25